MTAGKRVRVAVAALLLLFAQAQQLVHPLAHLAAGAGAFEVALDAPEIDDPCVECTLLASGGHAMAVAHAIAWLATVLTAPGRSAVASLAAGARAWFESRAPPASR